jgi:hemophore-related protein
MLKRSLTGLAVGVGSFALSFVAGTGVAFAAPDLGPAVNTTCTYPQLVAALNATGPDAGAAFNQSPVLQAGLQQFLASGPTKRQQMAEKMANAPAFAPYIPTIAQAFNTCNNF